MLPQFSHQEKVALFKMLNCPDNLINAYFQVYGENYQIHVTASQIYKCFGCSPEVAQYIIKMNKEISDRTKNRLDIVASWAGRNENMISAQLQQKMFSQAEIQAYFRACSAGVRFTSRKTVMEKGGFSDREAQRLCYMHGIVSGAKQVDSEEQMSKHLRKLDEHQHKVSISDLELSSVLEVPRLAIVNGINIEPYSVFNSLKYWKSRSNNKNRFNGLYKVLRMTSGSITVESPVKPTIEYNRGRGKRVDNMLEIHGIRVNGTAEVSFSSKYCKMCNRYVIMATTKRPKALHLGYCTITCLEGTRIYVCAVNIGTKPRPSSSSESRTYSWGIMPEEINSKLKMVTNNIYKRLIGNQKLTDVTYTKPNSVFNIVGDVNTGNSNEDDNDTGINL